NQVLKWVVEIEDVEVAPVELEGVAEEKTNPAKAQPRGAVQGDGMADLAALHAGVAPRAEQRRRGAELSHPAAHVEDAGRVVGLDELKHSLHHRHRREVDVRDILYFNRVKRIEQRIRDRLAARDRAGDL